MAGHWAAKAVRFTANVMKSKKIGCLEVAVVLMVLVGLFSLGFTIWARGHSYAIHNATYDEAAKAGVVRVFIPPQADNVTAWIRPGQMSIVASFEIQETNFVAWSQAKEWDLEEIAGVIINNISTIADPNGSETVVNGLMHKVSMSNRVNPNGLYRLYVYDRTKGIGYFTQL